MNTSPGLKVQVGGCLCFSLEGKVDSLKGEDG